MPSTRVLVLTIDIDNAYEADSKVRAILSSIHDSDALPDGINAVSDVETCSAWIDEANDLADSHHVEIACVSFADDCNRHHVSAVVTPAQAEAACRAIAAVPFPGQRRKGIE